MAVELSHASPVFFSSNSALDLKVVCVEADWKVTVYSLSIISVQMLSKIVPTANPAAHPLLQDVAS